MSKPPPTSTNTQAAAPTANLNPLSKFQERVEVPGLTLYEVHRDPRRENCKQALCKMELETLGSEFRCPVCLGYIKNATLVKECLHRFCCECIQKCLRTQKKKECPTCRVHIPSRRSLRPDVKFDALIASIYGDVNEIEKYEDGQNRRLNEKNISNAYAESRKMGIQYQAEQRKKRAHSGVYLESVHPHQLSASIKGVERARRKKTQQATVMIEIILRKHPQETNFERLKKEYIRASEDMTIERLKMFLEKKLCHTPHTDFQILAIDADDNPVVLPNEITLSSVYHDVCNDPMNEILLYYRVFASPVEDHNIVDISRLKTPT